MDELKIKDVGPGFLFYSPNMDASWPDEEWISLGAADVQVTWQDPDAPLINVHEKSVTFSMTGTRAAYQLWSLLTKRTHPRISAMHHAYRSKQGRR